nr:MAG TPA: hypothetical protein [Caudoviricetes sp.]
MADKPVTREEKYLAYLTGDYKGEIPKPITRKEKYLYELCLKGIGGEISPEEIKNAVNEYLEKNPVKPGATTEQAQQIEQNKTNIASLKEDLSNKITKFYASSQGETHLADSDNGKIMDMMLYGKFEQKQYSGTNLFDAQNAKTISGAFGLSVSISNNGIISIQGTVKGISGKAAFSILETQELFPLDVVFKAFELKESNCSVVTIRRTIADVSDKRIAIELSGLVTGTEISASFRLMMSKSEITTYEPFTGGQPSPSPDYPQEIKSVVNPTIKVTNKDGLKVQSVTLNNITLNAIPVSSGGNVTINGQQYVADYVDVERGKLVRLNRFKKITSNDVVSINASKILYARTYDVWDSTNYVQRSLTAMSNISEAVLDTVNNSGWNGESRIRIKNVPFANIDEAKSYFGTNDVYCCYPLATPEEIDLTPEEIAAFKALATYYPVTNISVNSEQLDGYTVFNYPINMENGWNYVKQQIGDTRDYIYDMDLQSAEAYVNSEYAVALTELEV